MMSEPTIVRRVLANGLVVVVAERRTAPLAATTLIYRAGSLHEEPGKTGLAHLMEHMMFRGTPTNPQGMIDATTGGRGGINNALTTTDYTAYYFLLPREHWRVPLEIEADRMVNCALDPGPFEKERRVALEERKMLEDDPDTALDEAIDRLALTCHPYRNPVVGLREDLETLSFADLKRFYADCYRPNNAILAIAGDVDADGVLRAAEELFGGIEPGVLPVASGLVEPPQRGPRHINVRGVAATPGVEIAFRCPESTHPDTPVIEVLATLLAGGRGSRFHRAFVAGDGPATDVAATRFLQKDPGLFYISASLHEGVDPGRFEEDVLTMLADLRRTGPSPQELERARRLFRVDLVFGRETALGLAGSIGFWEMLGGRELGDAFERSLLVVSGDDVVRILDTYFDPDVRSSAWLVPESE
jgi:zinc protease